MAKKGLKLYDYEYRKGLKVSFYRYYCPYCEVSYHWEEPCHHFLFELRNIPYFTDNPYEKEECEKIYEEYRKALKELDNEVETEKISVAEYWKKLSELNRELQKKKEEFVKKFVKED